MPFKSTGLLVLAFVAIPAAALEAPIRSVTLYPGSATVERVAQVAQGATRIEITGLLANFDSSTLRLQADNGIQVGQVVSRDIDRIDSPDPRVAGLDTKIEALRDQIALVDAEIRSAQMVVTYLESLRGGEGKEQAAPADAKALLGTIDAMRKGGSDAMVRAHEGEVRKRSLDQRLGVLTRERARLQGSAASSRVLTVSVAARQAGTLTLSYQVNRAGWKPAYRASLDSNASSVDLERLATISQKTGEDWSDIRLRLSTGQPSLGVAAPDPSPWLLSYRPPQPPAPPPGAMVDTRMFARAAAPAPVSVAGSRRAMESAADDYIAPVIENQGNFSTEFEVPARVDLASDGREISVGLSSQKLQVRQRVLVAPRSGEFAVLAADAARPAGVWLPGQVQLRRDGSYVGALYWNPVAEERLSLSFGRDPLVRVSVEKRDAQSGATGFFKRDNQRRIADTYVITSSHRQPIDLLVLEATPVSESREIGVKTSFSPEPSIRDWQGRRGLAGWERSLAPNATARFDVDYVINYPQQGTVSGLP